MLILRLCTFGLHALKALSEDRLGGLGLNQVTLHLGNSMFVNIALAFQGFLGVGKLLVEVLELVLVQLRGQLQV